MGVIINQPDPFVEYIDDALENLINEHVSDHEQTVRQKPRKSKQRSPTKPMDSKSARSEKCTGGRRNRRFENAAALMKLAEPQEFGELTINDFVRESVSAFAQVLMERDNVEAWSMFLNCSEEQQEKLLNSFNNGHNQGSSHECDEPMEVDARAVHPAFCADLNFQKVEGKLRAMLKKKHFPLGNLAYLEDQVTTFFSEQPRSVYISQLPSSFDRMLLHALCQYMDLHSESFDLQGARRTRVKNPKDEFLLPVMKLTAYLEGRLQQCLH